MTRNLRISIVRAMHGRQVAYENKYTRLFLAVLSKQFREGAKQYVDGGMVDPSFTQLERLYRKMYIDIIPKEAKEAWGAYVIPVVAEEKGYRPDIERKDIIDDLASILGRGQDEGERIRTWRQLAGEYFNITILSRIRQVMDTTRKAIGQIIEKGVNEGKGVPDIARDIRREAAGEVNQARARKIARTESGNALNRGNHLGIATSPYYWNKKWNAVQDDRTRLPHEHMNREPWIEFEQPFRVVNLSGTLDELDYPGDPKGSPENVINCRCIAEYRVRRDANGRPIRKSNI